MATDSVPWPIQVGLPELLQVFYAQYSICPNQRGETFHCFNCIFFQSSEQETLNEASSYLAFLKETNTLFLLGQYVNASPQTEKGA